MTCWAWADSAESPDWLGAVLGSVSFRSAVRISESAILEVRWGEGVSVLDFNVHAMSR